MLLVLLGAGIYVGKIWWSDYQTHRAGQNQPGALPGATTTSRRAVFIAVVGALVLLCAETYGEIALGLDQQQSEMTVLLGCYTLVAAFIEEVIFRGYLVINKRGTLMRIIGILAASLLFALFHPFLWQWEDGSWTWSFTAKGWFSTGAIFLGSLWFYFVRFMPSNPQHSLLPCFAAHATKNLGVFLIKAAQGFVTGLY
jgi:membrane protease YdiL (CAAX protease family)